MDEEELVQVPRTIKDYVNIAGGKVSLDALMIDFREAYKTDIPYEEFGYPDLYSFLRSIKGINVEKLDDDFYLLSNPRKKNHSIAINDQLDDISNISVQLTNNLLIADKSDRRKVTLRSPSRSTNVNARKSIISKMNLYSSSSSEGTVSEVNEVQNKELFSQNYIDSAPQAGIDSTNFQDLFSDDLSNSNPTLFGSQILFNNCNYYAPQSATLDTSSCNALPSYTQSPYYLPLIDFVQKHKLEFPVFETLTNVSPENDGIIFNTILRIGSDNFISPPFNDLTQSSIFENLLKTAYESLKNKPQYSFINTKQNLISNILEIINSYKSGVNTDFIKAAYVQRYNVSPPVNWFDLLESTSSVYIEPLSTQIMIYPHRTFLTATPYSTSLPDQILPNTDTWNVFISNGSNTSNIWFRILDGDYDIRYQVLLSELNKHYMHSIISDVSTVNIGELYVCIVEQNWYRAEVLSTRENIAECRFIDTGIKTELPSHSLFPLNHKFTNVPPLAFRCSMSGLKRYGKMNYVSCQLMKMLNNEVAVVKADTKTINDLSVEIFLKNNAFNVSVNKYFLNKIKNELSVSKITQVGELFDVYLLSVDESGVARVQVESGSLKLLKHALDCASKLIEQDENKRSFYVSPLLKLNLEKIYLARIDQSWNRIMINTHLNGNKASIECIDSGDHKIIDTRNIVLTDALPDTLIHISPQCQKVKILVQDSTTRKMINFMNRIFTETSLRRDNTYTIKVVKIEDDPVVQLYKRQNNDEVVPLKKIFFEKCEQVASINFVNNLSNILPDSLCFDLFSNVSSSDIFPKYEMKKGDILKVVVLKALNPSNFILKIENHPEFAEFMLDFNNYHSIFSPPAVSKISIGKCYAVHLENNIYYRGLALYVMEDLKTVVVRLLDFAETVSIPITAVYNTLPQFYSLPVQTVNAKLLNVKPLRGEWTQQDCYRFKEIVYQKILNCVIVDFTDTLCKVILLDDSSHQEIINVTSLLVDERRATLEEN